jgi:tetratricopeptide (TPR) repeat protein
MASESKPLLDYERNVGTTWMISFEAIEAKSKPAANLLKLWAFFDNKDPWHGLLRGARDIEEDQEDDAIAEEGNEEIGEEDGEEQRLAWLRELATSEIKFLDATRLLCRYSMIEAQEAAEGCYMIHPVAHRWSSHLQINSERATLIQLACILIGSLMPTEDDVAPWLIQRRLLPHAERCSLSLRLTLNNLYEFENTSMAFALHNLGALHTGHDRWQEAEAMYNRALKGKEKAYGLEHTSTLNRVNNLGSLYSDQGRWREAEAMYNRALHGYEKALPQDTIMTYIPALYAARNLGRLYSQVDEVGKALFHYKRAQRGILPVFGETSDHCNAISSQISILSSRPVGKIGKEDTAISLAEQGGSKEKWKPMRKRWLSTKKVCVSRRQA